MTTPQTMHAVAIDARRIDRIHTPQRPSLPSIWADKTSDDNPMLQPVHSLMNHRQGT